MSIFEHGFNAAMATPVGFQRLAGAGLYVGRLAKVDA